MASSQEKALRAEAEARQAASDRRWTEPDPEERPGVISSVIKAVQSAKEAVIGKGHDQHVGYCSGDGGGMTEETTELAAGARDEKAREAAERVRESKERTGEMKEKAKEAAGETKDYMAKKASEAADRTKQTAESTREKAKEMGQSAVDKTKEKAEEAKEKTKEMAESSREKTKDMGQSAAYRTKDTAQEAKEQTRETSQSVADKMKETTHSATSKLGQLKDKAMGFLSGKKEEAKEQAHDTAETAKEKLQDTEEETRQIMEELQLKGKDEHEGDAARRVREDKDESERRGGGILGAVGALKEMLTQPPRDTDKSLPADESREPRTGEEKQAVVEDASPGTVKSAPKASDQASRQTFNDVGRIEDEGVVREVRLDCHGKK